MSTTARVLLASMLVAAAAFVARATPAAAAPQLCAESTPRSAAAYQSVSDARSASFGVGDITSAVELPDGRIFFALGDTGYYDLQPDGGAGPLHGFGNNSAWVQSGRCFTLLSGTEAGSRSWVLPPQQDRSFYWPGASVVVGSRLYVFEQRLVADGAFGQSRGAAIAQFDLPSLALARITPMPWDAARVFGQGAVYDGGYLYAYASQLRTCAFCFSSDMYVARVPEAQLADPGAWRYRAASGWVKSFRDAQPVLRAAVSNVAVSPYGNGFLLVTKTLSIIGPPVEGWWAPNPDGPWTDLGTLFTVPDPPASRVSGFTYQSAYTYNPLIEPVRLDDHGLLGSYDVNTFSAAEAQRDGLLFGPRFLSVDVPAPPSAPRRAASTPGPSPWTPTLGVDRGGRVHTAGGGVGLAQPYTLQAVGVARTPSGRGGWVVAADGGVFAFGDASWFGSMGDRHLNQPIVGIAATPSGRGYWLVARDGGIFAFGDARFFGSTGNIRLNEPIVAMTASPTGAGYWFVASDGGIFAYGDARFFGSTGGAPPYFPITGMAAAPDGRGYWLVTLAGQVYTFGSAPYRGNAPMPLAAVVTGIVTAPGGYRIVDAAGNVFVRTGTTSTQHISSSLPLVGAG